jgi:hypothetical protein
VPARSRDQKRPLVDRSIVQLAGLLVALVAALDHSPRRFALNFPRVISFGMERLH